MLTNITFLGHSTVILDFNGFKVITDPVFQNRIIHLGRTAPVPNQEMLRKVDLVLISHLHYDHLDMPSLRMLGEKPLVCVPKGAGDFLRKKKIPNIRELEVGEEFVIGDIPIRTTIARHINTRHPMGIQAECMGYLIGDQVTVYFPGDTQIFPEMACLADRIDVALMPVWGWGPSLGRMHMGPKEAAQALALLKPKLAIPIHWGTYIPIGLAWLRPAFHSIPPLLFANFAAKDSPEVEVRILKPGESTVF